MARRRNKKQQKSDETLVDLIEVKDQAQSFVERNQVYVFGALVGAVLVFGGLFAYNNFFKAPKQLEAVDQMSQAQVQFARDSFALALTNPGGGYKGFVDIAENYKGTKAGNLALYYAGICYLQLGEYAAALDYLNDYNADGEVTPIMKYGSMGDAFAELNDLEKAMKYYRMAIDSEENDFLVPYYLTKVGLLQEKNGDFQSAQSTFQKIKDDYPAYPGSQDAEKYLARVSGKIGQ